MSEYSSEENRLIELIGEDIVKGNPIILASIFYVRSGRTAEGALISCVQRLDKVIADQKECIRNLSVGSNVVQFHLNDDQLSKFKDSLKGDPDCLKQKPPKKK